MTEGDASLPARLRERLRSRLSAVDWREVGLNLSLVVMSFLLVFAGFEGALRTDVIEYEGPTGHEFEYCEGPEEPEAFHPEYGWARHPNSSFFQSRSRVDDFNYHAHNAAGFRDTYDSGEPGIVTIGDSFMEGALVDQNSTAANLLDRWTPETSIHNYAVGGWGTTQEYLVYREEASEIPHDAVVLVYAKNDMANNVQERPRRPRFAFRNGSLTQVHEPVDRKWDDGGSGVLDEPWMDQTQRFLKEHVATYNYLEPRIRTVLIMAGVISLPEPPTDREVQRQVRITRALIESIDSEARRNDARLYLLAIPTRGEIYPENPTTVAHRDPQAYRDRQVRMLRSVAANSSNAEYVDFTQPLLDAKNGSHRLYGRINGHLDDYGQRVLARTLHDRLRADGHVTGVSNRDRLDERYDPEYQSCP